MAISQYPAASWESYRRKRNCLPEIATSAFGLLAMTSLGALHICRKYLQICSCQRRSLTAATDAIGAYRFHGGLYKSAVPPRDCTPRALPRAARSGRHVGLWPPRNDNSGSFAILTAACTRRKCGTGSGMTLPYNGVCGRRECTEICRCATRRRGRRPLQRTAGSLGKFSIFRLPRAFLSCQIQKSDRLIWVSRSGFYGNTA